MRVLLALVIVTMGCDVCGLINQEVVVAIDDPDLGGLISDCRNHVPPATAPTCVSDVTAPIDCACMPLCERVFAIVEARPNRPALKRCSLRIDMSTDQARIGIEYRSVCQ